MLLYKNAAIPKKNLTEINFYFIYALVSRMVFFYSIIVIFFLEFGLSFTAIMILSSVESIASMLFEIPSGMFADFFGRKKTVIIGTIISVAGVAAYVIHPSFALFVIAELLLSIGSSCISGTASSLSYSKFKSCGCEEHFHDFQSFAASKVILVGAFVSIFSTIFFDYNVFLPFVLSCTTLLIAILFLLKVGEEKGEELNQYEGGILKTVAEYFKTSIKDVLNNKSLLDLILLNSLFGAAMASVLYVSNAYLRDLGMNFSIMGFYLFLGGLVASFFAKRSKLIYDKLKERIFAVLLLTLAVIVALLSIQNLIIVAVLFILTRSINGIISPIFSTNMNRVTSDNNRATVLSMASFVQSAVFIAVDPVIGMLIDRQGMSTSYLILGVFLFAIAIIYTIVSVRKRKKELY